LIESRNDYLQYLEEDRIGLQRTRTLRALLFDDVWRFQRLLRRLEYLTNCNRNRLVRTIVSYRYSSLGRKLGFDIALNVFGPGLAIAHRGTIVVSPGTEVGANCRLHVCVNIGTAAGKDRCVPKIGDNCYIGPGVKMFGSIEIGPNTAIGANAVVNRSFPLGNMTIAGVPARKISDKSSDGLLVKAHRDA
jgi:serine O-acetyltransferase